MGDTPLGKVVQTAVPVLVLTIATFMILEQLKIAHDIVVTTYTLVLGAIALGAALAFGLGGRDVARQMLEGAYAKGQENKEQFRRDLDQGMSTRARTRRSASGTSSTGRRRRRASAAARTRRPIRNEPKRKGHRHAAAGAEQRPSGRAPRRAVYDDAGEKIGSVEEIFYDPATSRPEWVGIGTGLFGTKRVLVPVEGARVTEDGLMVALPEGPREGRPGRRRGRADRRARAAADRALRARAARSSAQQPQPRRPTPTRR